jgi:hypothetical protein
MKQLHASLAVRGLAAGTVATLDTVVGAGKKW